MSADGPPYGDERLKASLVRHAALPLPELADELLEDIRQFTLGTEQYDDETFVLMRITPGAGRTRRGGLRIMQGRGLFMSRTVRRRLLFAGLGLLLVAGVALGAYAVFGPPRGDDLLLRGPPVLPARAGERAEHVLQRGSRSLRRGAEARPPLRHGDDPARRPDAGARPGPGASAPRMRPLVRRLDLGARAAPVPDLRDLDELEGAEGGRAAPRRVRAAVPGRPGRLFDQRVGSTS